MEFKIGQTVEVRLERPKPTTHRGVIRYIGPVAVPGQEGIEFVGIELPTATGKNDGSAQGERYFKCAPMHGLFVGSDKVTKIIEQPRPAAPKAAPPKPTASSARSRPSSVSGAPQPPSRPARLSAIGTSKSSTLQSRLSAAAKSPANGAPPSRSPSTTSRTSATSAAPSRRLSTVASSQPSTAARPARKPSVSSATSAEPRAAPPTPTARAPTERTRQIPEAEYRRLQKQQEDTTELEAEVLKLRSENEKVKSICAKLEAKCQQNRDIISGLREEVAKISQLEAEKEKLERTIQERDDLLELATIDKEMAEEQKEQVEAELESERAVIEELRLELEIKQEETSFIDDDMPEEEKLAVMLRKAQSERDRYREGLVRLRDISKEQVKDLEARNRELEAQAAHVETVEADLAAANANVVRLDGFVADLREQLDTNNEMEEMNEELIEKTQNLEDSIASLQLERKELSMMIEVSNETINDYAEHADELEAELEMRDAQLADVSRQRDATLDEMTELQGLLSKYQTAAMEMQAQIRELQADKATTEEEVKDVTGRFNEVMDLQRRLRNAGIKDTNRQIDSSLQQLAAREAQEQLAMVKHYLTESAYTDFHSSAVQAYFRVKSVSFKADLTASVFRRTTTDPFGTEKGPEQVLDALVRHDVIGHFEYIHTYAEHIWAAMASCSLEEFTKAGQLYQEFESVLRTVEGCMGALKRDELNLKDSLDSARGSYNVLGAIYRSNGYLSNARPDSTIILHSSIIRSSLDRVRSVFDAVKTFVSRVEPVYEDVEDHVDLGAFMEPAQTVTETLNVITKFGTVLQALQKDNLYPNLPDGIKGLVEISESLDRFANKANENAVAFIRLVLGKLAKEPEAVDATLMSGHLETLFPRDMLGKLNEFLQDARSRIGQWNEHASVPNNCLEVQLQPAPWVVKAQQIEAEKKQSIDTEKKLHAMTSELQSALLQVRERQETIETKELEIEHLRARNQESAVKAGTIEALQAELNKAHSERKAYRAEIETLQAEITRLEREGVQRIEDTPQGAQAAPQPTRERSETIESPQSKTSGAFVTLVNALKEENKWLRRRQREERLTADLDAVFTKARSERAARVKADARRKQALAAEMLEMAFTSNLRDVRGSAIRPLEISNEGFAVDAKTKGSVASKSRRGKGRSGAAPLTLKTDEMKLVYLDDVSFVDLSPVADEFAVEVLEY
ncbi:hypothetical protein BU23DRAFT_550474 [Bimuria novae-zelandiae CBS 107.79]|uniref:CAP-Gly domain-containing protein n=1 Tax=Bimuria novae-zelandiae CBS 107.79 TaxID=1447943 RepID=A0A6A5VMU2_9PLEO|nr:hypothetical protein BU23DRAFT_550474 [Bimuria novae-zelandiae CBS 107.79]